MKKCVKVILNIIGTLIVLTAVIIAFLLVGIKMFGLELYIVLSGSMEPTYHVGSLIYVQDVKIDELQIGNTVTFYVTNKTIATHRIVEIDKDDTIYLITKGDANEKNDEKKVREEDVIGKPMFSIPYLGYLVNFIQTKYGMFITVGVGILLFIIVMTIDAYLEEEKKKEKIKKIGEE